MMKERTREEWEAVVREYRESGESCLAFCERRDIPFGSLRRRLGGRSRKLDGGNPLFVELRTTASRELNAFSVTLSNGWVVSVPQDFQSDSLVRLLKAVEVVRC